MSIHIVELIISLSNKGECVKKCMDGTNLEQLHEFVKHGSL